VGSPATLYIFLFTFMVVWFNSLLVDIFCYVRISRSNPSFAVEVTYRWRNRETLSDTLDIIRNIPRLYPRPPFSLVLRIGIFWLSHKARIISPLPLRVAKTGRKHLNEEFTPLLPTGIGERF
jgi:hypothetical protein